MQFRPITPTAPRPARRSTGDRLREALVALAQGHACIASHRETPWASVTFAGSRHTFDLLFEGATPVAAGEDFIAALPDHDFTLPRQLVADAAIVSVEHTMLPGPRLAVTAELLLLDDG